MPRHRRRKNQQRNNNNNKKQQGNRHQAQQQKTGKSDESAIITTGNEPIFEEIRETDPDEIQITETSSVTSSSEHESENADHRSCVQISTVLEQTQLEENFEKLSDTFNVELQLPVDKTGSASSIESKGESPSQDDTITLSASLPPLSPSSSESDTLKEDADSPDREITNVPPIENNNNNRDITNVNANLPICDNESATDMPVATDNREQHTKQSEACITPIRHPIVQEVITTLYSYRVESPKPMKPKTAKIVKSKSLDDDDIMIQEMSDNSSAGDLTDNQPLISEASESEADSEATEVGDKKDSMILSVQTLPLDEAYEELVKAEEFTTTATSTVQEEQDVKAKRAKKRAAIETHFMPQFLNPRYLDSIKEENSDTSDADKKSDTQEPLSFGELEDDVFADCPTIPNKANAVFPKSNLDFTQKKKHVSNLRPPKTGVIREESPCFVLETKIIEPESVEESCSTWTAGKIAESDAPEVVYIDSASSSASDLLELDYAGGNDADVEDLTEDIDVQIETPTIEVDSNIFSSSSASTLTQHSTSPPVTNDSESGTLTKSSSVSEENLSGEAFIASDVGSETPSCNIQSAVQSEYNKSVDQPKSDINKTIVDSETNKLDFKIGEPCSNNMFATLVSPLMSDIDSISKLSENNTDLVRQDSAGSHGSGQSQSTVNSQCTAINKGPSSQTDLVDFDFGPCVSETSAAATAFKTLRQLCLEALASMPYGKIVLEELATVSESLNHLTKKHQELKVQPDDEMPYPLPDIPRIDDLEVPVNESVVKSYAKSSHIKLLNRVQSPPPPPVPELPKMESWLGLPTEEDPKVLVCLSPSQRDYIKDVKVGADTSADSLLDMHKKFIERRGYHEMSEQQVEAIRREKSHLGQVVSSTQLMKSTTPPPPIPPPPSEHLLMETEIVTNPIDDKNNHRLLAIIRDSQQSSSESTSQKIEQVDKSQCTFATNDQRSDQETQTKSTEKVQPQISTTESEKSTTDFGKEMFYNYGDPFEATKRRFSNIETTPLCSQLMQTIPKRYSNIETSSFTSKKRIENGNVIYDITDSNKQKFRDGDNIPDRVDSIMSDVKLETDEQRNEAPKAQQENNFYNSFENRKAEENKKASNDHFAYDEFRQRAKESAQRAKSEFFDREMLKDFDELNKFFKDDYFGSGKKKSEPTTFKVPIKIERNGTSSETYEKTVKNESSTTTDHKVYTIPVVIEDQNKKSNDERKETISTERKEETHNVHRIPINVETEKKNDKMTNHREHRFSEKRLSSQNLDEWMRYIDDLGASSENITKPLQKEVEMCIGRRSKVRAPRLSASTSNLSTIGLNDDKFYNPLGYEKKHHYTSSQSTIDTTPISPYLSPHSQRRRSLPKECHDRQLSYIKLKEKELQEEFDKLEYDRRRLMEEMDNFHANRLRKDVYHHRSCRLPTLSEEEAFRQQMHDEWLNKVAEREERRLHKIIKISAPEVPSRNLKKSASTADISDEFLKRVKERRSKLCMPSDSDWESGAESQPIANNSETKTECDSSVKVIEGRRQADFQHLPKHMREFAEYTNQFLEQHKEESSTYHQSSAIAKKDGIWSPNNKFGSSTFETNRSERKVTSQTPPTPPPLPVWSPQASPTPGRKEFRPVRFESPVLGRRFTTQRQDSAPVTPPWSYTDTRPFGSTQSTSCSNLNSYQGNQHLRKAESLGTNLAQQSKGASYTETNRPKIPKDITPAFVRPNEVIYSVKNEYMSEPESENDRPKKMAQLTRRKFDGIGPTTKDGMPIVLRSEVKENNQHKWYKRMYNTLHRAKDDDEYVTIHYKTHRGRYPYKSNGYMSEPEPNYDSDYSTMKYHTLDRRRIPSTGSYQEERNYGTMPNPVKPGSGPYKNQPGRIENYITGHSSVSDKEKKEWWDEVMDIFNGHLEQQKLSSSYTEGYLSRALKEQGYESDSNLVFRKKNESQYAPLSPVEQRQAYRSVQSGGEPPLQGFRKPAPEKPKESPRRYIEGDVNIHYKSPIRYEYKDAIPEEELARKQADSMKKLYQEERRRKYLQELQDMNSRRHTDNFTPSQKSPISLNRYDDFPTDISPKSPGSATFPRTIARALYNFQGQTARELTFKKGDVIYIRRQIDKNWYEGEHNAMVGLLPANYVEIVTKDGARQPPRKPSEGQARAKFNFSAQSAIELSLNKGELVTLTRRVDDNWFEGKIANRKGIFPVAYVDVLTDIGVDDCSQTATSKPVGAPASHSLITHTNTTPSLDTLRTNLNNEFNSLTNGHPPNGLLRETKSVHKTEVLHVDTNSEPVAYRALYKYRPQNNDELELQEGDIVYVLEKCDDGWYVGTSQRTGCFGTFPGNYVERV